MKNIYGTIGYTTLENTRNNNKIIVFSDMHGSLPSCDPNQIKISSWFQSKFNSSKILLEEVPRDGFNLEELWDQSPHTQDLKNLYLSETRYIQAVDIRPYLIPFSWELIDKADKNTILKTYLREIDNFFCLKSNHFLKNLDVYNKSKLKNTDLGKHFLKIKKNYGDFLLNHNNLIEQSIEQIHDNKIELLHQINIILDEIMEWYICANIMVNQNKSIILHTGLAHSEKVIRWLLINYNYIIIKRTGVNSLSETKVNMSGCVQLPTDIDSQFGGFLTNY